MTKDNVERVGESHSVSSVDVDTPREVTETTPSKSLQMPIKKAVSRRTTSFDVAPRKTAQKWSRGDSNPRAETENECNVNDLQSSPDSRDAKSGAFEAKTSDIDFDLALIIERWEELPEAVKAGIVAMVKASDI